MPVIAAKNVANTGLKHFHISKTTPSGLIFSCPGFHSDSRNPGLLGRTAGVCTLLPGPVTLESLLKVVLITFQ